MKTVVTGGAGFIGSHLVKALVKQGRQVIIADKFADPTNNNLTGLGVKESDANFMRVDLTDYHQALATIKGADSVFHLAARIGNIEYLHGSQEAELNGLQMNLLTDANVFKACLETGVKKIVYSSSCAVYPLYKQVTQDAVLTEDDLQIKLLTDLAIKPAVINPDGGYGWAKLMGEMQLGLMKGINIGIARIFNAYGENEPLGEIAHVMGDFISRAIRNSGDDFTVYGDGTQSRDFLYVSDCISALIKLEGRAANPPLTVNIGSGKVLSVSALAKEVIKISGKKFNLTFDSTKPIGPISRTANISKARSLLDWEPEISLGEGLRQTYAWAKNKLT